MKVFKINLNNIKGIFPKSVLGLGYFDGVHLGHQKLIKKVITKSIEFNCKSSIITFDKSIDAILKNNFEGEISPLKYRLQYFKELGIDIVYVICFNKEIASISSNKFIEAIKKLNVISLVSGNDFKFGHKGEGDIKLLSKHFSLDVVPFLESNNIKISSSNIIKLIKEGKIKECNLLLGRPYIVEAKVIKGYGIGKEKLLPTINTPISGFVKPKEGVYRTKTIVNNRKYDSISYFGTHPTINELKEPILETFIYNFNRKIYRKHVKIEFLDFIRDSIKFENVEILKSHINLDTFSDF